MRKILTFLIAIVALTSSSTLAQTGTIRGFVYEKASGEPAIFTAVSLEKTTYGVATDVNGYFSLSKVPAGNYTIIITSLGFDTMRQAISIKANEITPSMKLYLTKGSIKLKDFTVSAEKKEAQTETRTSVNRITPVEIKKIPTVGGEPDLAQYLQVLPGVVFTGDQGGQLYIRGGSPVQNKVLIDGMIIYNPFHSIGLFSVFDADIIRNADVYTGGFGAQYGGRISSIMDITTKDGNKKRLSGKFAVSPFGAKTMLEGPLKKLRDDSKGSASYIISAKNSYLAQTSKLIYTPMADALPKDQYGNSSIPAAGLPYNFLDLYAKVSFNSNNGSKLNVFGFNFDDKVNFPGTSDLNWKSWGAGSNFVVVPSGSQVLIKGNFAYSKYGVELNTFENLPRSSTIDGFNMGLNFTYFMGKDELNYGIEVLGFETDFNFYNAYRTLIKQVENTTELAGYFKYKLTAGKLLFEPSMRIHYYASLAEASPEPRLAMKYNITDVLRLKFATGHYAQNLMSANSDRDVVNLFYGFLSGSDNLQEDMTMPDGSSRAITSKLQKANHAIGGVEIDITRHLNLNVEAYYKKFGQLTNLNRNKIFEDNADNYDRADYLKKDFIVETGTAKGIDLALKYEFKRYYLWVVYSLGHNKRYDGVLRDKDGNLAEYAPFFDRRHNINLVGSYTFGKRLDWEFDARWNMGSGFPFTRTQGFYEQLDFQNGLNTNYTTDNGQLGILYAALSEGRLPYYHRLDLNLKKKIFVSINSTLEMNFGITNAYNRRNIFYIDRVTGKKVYQLPFLPTIGASLTF